MGPHERAEILLFLCDVAIGCGLLVAIVSLLLLVFMNVRDTYRVCTRKPGK